MDKDLLNKLRVMLTNCEERAMELKDEYPDDERYFQGEIDAYQNIYDWLFVDNE